MIINCDNYIVDLSLTINKLREYKATSVLIQAPDGLKHVIKCIYRYLTKEFKIYISASPTYGGCDVAFDEAIMLNADAIIHIGHNEYPLLGFKPSIPVIYIPAYYDWKPSREFINNMINVLRVKGVYTIGLSASIQHVNTLRVIRDILLNHDFKPIIPPAMNGLFEGQVLGCIYSLPLSIDNIVDVHLVIAGGRFHALGLAMISSKPVLGVDPYREELWDATEYARRVLMKRLYVVNKIRNDVNMRIAGVIAGVKPGQYRLNIVNKVLNILENHGFESYVFFVRDLNIDRLIAIDNAFKPDFYIVTSCPRLPIDDLSDFYKPVITPGELEMVFRDTSRYVYPW